MADESYLSALHAWHGQQVQSTVGKGKNVRAKYKKFKDFYNHQKTFEAVFTGDKPIKKPPKMALINRLMNEKGGNDGE